MWGYHRFSYLFMYTWHIPTENSWITIPLEFDSNYLTPTDVESRYFHCWTTFTMPFQLYRFLYEACQLWKKGNKLTRSLNMYTKFWRCVEEFWVGHFWIRTQIPLLDKEKQDSQYQRLHFLLLLILESWTACSADGERE